MKARRLWHILFLGASMPMWASLPTVLTSNLVCVTSPRQLHRVELDPVSGEPGAVLFSTKVPGRVDARVLTADSFGTPAGDRFLGQLYAGPPDQLPEPVGPILRFPASPETARGYLVDGAVVIPNVLAGTPTQVKLVAWAENYGSTYAEASALRHGGIGESATITVTAGTEAAPAYLEGLSDFTIACCAGLDGPFPPVAVHWAVNGHMYERFEWVGISWSDARAQAASRALLGETIPRFTAHLVTINSALENRFLTSVAELGNGPSDFLNRYWIGAYQPADAAEPAGDWRWVTGEPFTYANWSPLEPNDSHPGEDVAMFNHQFSNDGKQWNDAPDAYQAALGFVVEYEPMSLPPSTNTVTVPGTADPWLAGATNGTVLIDGDSAPAQSPVQVPGIVAGQAFTFLSSGGVANGPDFSLTGPDGYTGNAFPQRYPGAENGIADVRAPMNALMGVFLDDTAPGGSQPVPPALDFAVIGLDFQVFTPSLRQPFFIGDGRNKDGTVQRFFAPEGATRLFLGTMDSSQWNNNRGSFTVQADASAGTLIWSFDAGQEFFRTCAALGTNGTVYLGSGNGSLYAIDGLTGQQKWSFRAGAMDPSPAVGVDGTVFIGTLDGSLYALEGTSGRIRWKFTTGGSIQSSAAIGFDGTIYVGSWDGHLYAIDGQTGMERWRFLTGGWVDSSPAVGRDGTVYFGSEDGFFYALSGDTGTKKWQFQAAGGVLSSPAIGADGTIYFGCSGQRVYALNGTTGQQVWAFETDGSVTSSPAIGSDGTIYIGGGWNSTAIYALEGATGRKLWETRTGGDEESSPAIGVDGVLYIGSGDSRLYALETATGRVRWTYATAGRISGSPAIGANGTVYVGSWDGRFYAIRGDSYGRGGLADSEWPKLRGNAQNTGRVTRYPPVQSPPVIQEQPADQLVLTGGTATFSVGFTSSSPVTFLWMTNQQPIPGATNEVLVLSNVQPHQAGGYSVRVSNSYGSVTSRAAMLSLASPGEPIIGPAGHYYTLVKAPGIPWAQANSEAEGSTFQGMRGHLATLHSLEENVFLDRSFSHEGGEFWLGGFQSPVTEPVATNGWTWVNGEGPFPGQNGGPGYTRWGQNEPNDAGNPGQEQYLGIRWDMSGTWNDEASLSNISGYVVEFSPPSNTPPVLLTQPEDLHVAVQEDAMLAVVASGGVPLSYLWSRLEGPLLSGDPTAPSLIFTNVQTADAGRYFVVITNPYGAVTSRIATVTVVATPRPRLLSATTPGDPRRVTVVFSVPVDPASATRLSNYTLSDGSAPLGAELTAPDVVVLQTTLTRQGWHTLRVTGVQSDAPDPLPVRPDSSATFLLTDGQVNWTVEDRMPAGRSLDELLNDPRYLHGWVSRSGTVPRFESPSDDLGARFLGRLRAYLYPPVSGAYRFWLWADDSGVLYLGDDGNPGNKRIIARSDAPSPRRQYAGVSDPVELVSGQRYYLEAVYLESDGFDGVGVAWQLPGAPPPAPGDPPLGPEFISSLATEGSPAVNRDAVPLELEVGQPWEIALAMSDLSGSPPLSLQWTWNGAPLPGADRMSLRMPWAELSDAGAIVGLIVSNAYGITHRTVATLSVLTNAVAPSIAWVEGSHDFASLRVHFSEAVHSNSVADLADYSLTGGPILLSAGRHPDGRSAILQTSPQTPGATYELTVRNIQDLDGNTMPSEVRVPFPAYVEHPGQVVREVWRSDQIGIHLESLLALTAFQQDRPNSKAIVSGAEAPSDDGEHFGQRLWGWLVPTITGEYRLAIAADESAALYLGRDERRTNLDRVAYTESRTEPREWGRYVSQVSEPRILQAGQAYAFEAVMCEGQGSDHLALGWVVPGASAPEPIGADSLVLRLDPRDLEPTVVEPPTPVVAYSQVGGTFRVRVRGGTLVNGTPSYQWQRDSVDVPGATASEYVLPVPLDAARDQNARYRCVVTDTAGNRLLTSEAALTVLPQTDPVRLGFTVEAGRLVLTWKAEPGVHLQQSPHLRNPEWRDVPDTEGVGKAEMPVTVGARLFRLFKTP